MARSVILPLLLIVFNFTKSQDIKVITAFDPLIDHTWEITGKWVNGLEFRQELTLKKEASGTIITVNTKGFLNEEQTEWGPRNYGIRQIDAATGKMMFYEFDSFGQMTKGEVKTKGKSFFYVYEYEGLTLADRWEFVDEKNYNYTIGAYNDGKIGEIYLKGTVKRKD